MAVSPDLARTYNLTTEQQNPRSLVGTLGPVERQVIADYLAQNPSRITPREKVSVEATPGTSEPRRRSKFNLVAMTSGIGLGIFRYIR